MRTDYLDNYLNPYDQITAMTARMVTPKDAALYMLISDDTSRMQWVEALDAHERRLRDIADSPEHRLDWILWVRAIVSGSVRAI